VLDYFRHLVPLMVYQLTPLAALVATLITLAILAKNNEVTAFKASGISLYRVTFPLLVAGLLLSLGMFVLDDTYLPYANQRQDAIRNQIKGKPAQTFYQPTHRWIFGSLDHIYNYEFFDSDQNLFAGLNVFELDPQTFQMRRRIYASQAHWEPPLEGWVLENGWVRDFAAGNVTSFRTFKVSTFNELAEQPSYFKREVLPSSQMNWSQLARYIDGLRQAGFDTARLSVEWQRKFAFPLIAAIIVFLSAPFAFLVGTRGALGGLALAIGISILYWAMAALFEAMGSVGQLPPLLAGWAPDAIFAFLGAYFFLRMPT
jgi:LPS export ABC transporter permease LptG